MRFDGLNLRLIIEPICGKNVGSVILVILYRVKLVKDKHHFCCCWPKRDKNSCSDARFCGSVVSLDRKDERAVNEHLGERQNRLNTFNVLHHKLMYD